MKAGTQPSVQFHRDGTVRPTGNNKEAKGLSQPQVSPITEAEENEETEGLMQEEAEEEQEEKEETEEDEEEGEKPKTVNVRKRPTQKQRMEHEATHIPYQSWCRHCVRGRGRNRPHRKKKREAEKKKKQEEERKVLPSSVGQAEHTTIEPGLAAEVPAESVNEEKVPKIAMDYFFLGESEIDASDAPCIVMVDTSNGNKYMRAVEQKGLGQDKDMEWLVLDMHDELKSWGFPGGGENRLILKSDGEPSIVNV